jgi:sulfoxide reductase heme-binding subunit YedZ
MPKLTTRTLRILTHLGGVFPFAWIVFDYFTDNLTFNPIQDVTLRTGKAALIFLVLSLAATPVNFLFRYPPALAVRKALGLYAFFYVSLHLLIFVGWDYVWDPNLIAEAILEKRYALVGFVSFLILLPLAITSTKGWQKRLGKKWKRLHRWVYLAAGLAIVHYVWLVKSDIREPLAYGAVLGLLLLLRVPVVKSWIGTGKKSLRRVRNSVN